MKLSARITIVRRSDLSRTRNAMREMEAYCASHPGSPAAVRRPVIRIRGGTCVALLGRSVEEGIVGLGSTVSAALRAFDVQYLSALRPPDRSDKRGDAAPAATATATAAAATAGGRVKASSTHARNRSYSVRGESPQTARGQ